MSTTPQRMLAWRWLPRFHLWQLLLAMTAVAALMWTYRQAMFGSQWAIAVLFGLGSLCVFMFILIVLALAAWIPSRIIVGNVWKRAGSPFADGQLPPAMTRVPKESAD
jgi:hypothetical protein